MASAEFTEIGVHGLLSPEEKGIHFQVTQQRVDQIKSGDAEAFGPIWQSHYKRIFRHIYYIVNDHDRAEDLAANSFLRAHEEILNGKYEVRPGKPFGAWMLRVAHNLTVSDLRAQRRHSEETIGISVVSPQDVEVEVSARLEIALINNFLREMAPNKRDALLMFIDGTDYKDIAASLETSVNNARVLKNRAVNYLRERLSPEEKSRGTKS
ncbi:MAG TPA: RNA polymerase sigma factor [Candidatus Saccharimonadales bacterium]|nr:RNA polymerase sigma factor [Candidatus Saccharimonadales bacterium]